MEKRKGKPSAFGCERDRCWVHQTASVGAGCGTPEELAASPDPVLCHDPARFRSQANADGSEERPSGAPCARSTFLRDGCYFIRFTPVLPESQHGSLHYDGTMRVEADDGFQLLASGDLYLHEPLAHGSTIAGEPDPARGIPIFPIKQYSYYLRVVEIRQSTPSTKSLHFGFEMHRFFHDRTTNEPVWTNEGLFSADMEQKTAPPGYLSSSDYYSGEVTTGTGAARGTLTMGWVSPHLRRAVIEIDKVREADWPIDSGTGIGWRAIFAQAGWDVTVVTSDPDVSEPADGTWSIAEVHAAMLKSRDSADLDTQWRYHLLCIRRLEEPGLRGIMYDSDGTDSNKLCREGAAIASHWPFWEGPFWGGCSGKRLGEATGPYFRTAVHEISHAMCLYHPVLKTDNHLMQDSYEVARNANPPQQFPDNIQWRHSPGDQKLLRHMPDIRVRPGGISFGWGLQHDPVGGDASPVEIEGLELHVHPVLDVVPIGAPVRVEYSLANRTRRPVPIPASLSMKTGHVKGHVIDPSGTVRTYSTVVFCQDGGEQRVLDPEQSVSHSMTLLRGAQGPLFPSPGFYRIGVQVSWAVDGLQIGLDGETCVMIMPPVDEEHARIALKILSTPDALLTLAIGGDHLEEGIEAIQAGLSHSALHPHYAFIEAKRLGKKFQKRGADLEATAGLIGGEPVLSRTEAKHAAGLLT